MSIGNGIAIAGVWIFVAAAVYSKYVSGFGVWLALVVGVGMTLLLR